MRPNPRDIASTAPVIGPGQELKIRLSCDLHGCLDFGSLTEGVWSTESRSSLVNWLTSSQYHQVGVCTYIGLKGLDSQKRRNNAVSEVHRFNQDYHTNLRILITTDREKHVLSPEHVSEAWTPLSTSSSVSSGCQFSRGDCSGAEFQVGAACVQGLAWDLSHGLSSGPALARAAVFSLALTETWLEVRLKGR